MSGPIEFACPHCEQVTTVPLELAGKEGRCPGCRAVILVPDPGAKDTLVPARLGSAPLAGEEERRGCPFCGEPILRSAQKCRFCGEFLRDAPRRASTGARPPSYLALSILTTLCCCQVLGIVAIVYAAQVDSRWNAGDRAGAADASEKARYWALVAFLVGLLVNLVVAGLAAAG